MEGGYRTSVHVFSDNLFDCDLIRLFNPQFKVAMKLVLTRMRTLWNRAVEFLGCVEVVMSRLWRWQCCAQEIWTWANGLFVWDPRIPAVASKTSGAGGYSRRKRSGAAIASDLFKHSILSSALWRGYSLKQFVAIFANSRWRKIWSCFKGFLTRSTPCSWGENTRSSFNQCFPLPQWNLVQSLEISVELGKFCRNELRRHERAGRM